MAFFDRTLKIFTGVTSLVWSTSAFAGDGQPSPWQMTFQKANSPIMEQITRFHDYLTIIIILITLFVLGLLVYVMVRFNERRHPAALQDHAQYGARDCLDDHSDSYPGGDRNSVIPAAVRSV